jgi:hypothetical protein
MPNPEKPVGPAAPRRSSLPQAVNAVLMIALAGIALYVASYFWRGWSDPARDLLPPGSQAVVVGTLGASLEESDARRLETPWLEPGVRVTVGNDPGDPIDPQHQPRKVQVTVETGKLRNASVRLNRSDLRPLK